MWWMPNSVCKGFGLAIRTGSSRRYQWYFTTWTYTCVSCPLGICGSRLISIHTDKKESDLSWHIGCKVSLKSNLWPTFHGKAKPFVFQVWALITNWRVVPGYLYLEMNIKWNLFKIPMPDEWTRTDTLYAFLPFHKWLLIRMCQRREYKYVIFQLQI